jgi:hypothetical protein
MLALVAAATGPLALSAARVGIDKEALDTRH